ncbi:MAG TPA: BON domain-containing protein [Pyrinomonadaceae bacterium]|nr:BON domain-containing protein [Pyrinomonadaceae bacterium]
MTKKMTSVFFTFVFLVTLIALSSPAFGQCEKNADSQIVAAIYADIKADKGLAAQISHINVISTSGAVKLQGWADDQSSYDKVNDIALKTTCVKLVNVNSFAETPPAAGDRMRSGGGVGCASGTKPCGDICIPEGDACNLGGFLDKSAFVFRFDTNFFLGLAAPDNSCG